MLPGLTKLEFQRLQFSVGKTTRQRRPLSPVEVGELCAKCVAAGACPNEITEALKMTDKGMVPKFLRVKDIVPTVRHLVSWGFSGDAAVGFSVAAQLARLPQKHHLPLAEGILKYGLSRNEMISVIQLLERSQDPLELCVQRVVRRRPVVRLQQIVLGSVTAESSVLKLRALSQLERDDILDGIIHRLFPNAKDFTAKLGTDRFAIIGGKSVAETVAMDPKIELNINNSLRGALP